MRSITTNMVEPPAHNVLASPSTRLHGSGHDLAPHPIASCFEYHESCGSHVLLRSPIRPKTEDPSCEYDDDIGEAFQEPIRWPDTLEQQDPTIGTHHSAELPQALHGIT
jgi:hypothetical protein